MAQEFDKFMKTVKKWELKIKLICKRFLSNRANNIVSSVRLKKMKNAFKFCRFCKTNEEENILISKYNKFFTRD